RSRGSKEYSWHRASFFWRSLAGYFPPPRPGAECVRPWWEGRYAGNPSHLCQEEIKAATPTNKSARRNTSRKATRNAESRKRRPRRAPGRRSTNPRTGAKRAARAAAKRRINPRPERAGGRAARPTRRRAAERAEFWRTRQPPPKVIAIILRYETKLT